jgi:hypothetical protein
MSFVWKDGFFDGSSDPNLGCVRVIISRKMRWGACSMHRRERNANWVWKEDLY